MSGAAEGSRGAPSAPELLLVALPRWFDAAGELPGRVVDVAGSALGTAGGRVGH